ncbi:MAG: hypothetical protein MJZ16_00290 [Bacteroidales bacterium]|nr:hypothetical protein [Bacteroidales bacterium]
MTDTELFQTKVIPIMDSVAKDLRAKQVEEYRKESFSLRGVLAGAAGPDGGMAADSAFYHNLRINGEWNSKTVEDYIRMVKDELKRQNITASPQMEKMMIDKMVKDQMPKSSIEYILRKAAGNSLFSLAEEAIKSPLQKEIDAKGEAMYNPSNLEKGIGWGLGAAADFMAMGGSGLVSGLSYVGTDIAINSVSEHLEQKAENVSTQESRTKSEPEIHVPLVLRPGQEQNWIEDQKRKTESKTTEPAKPEEVTRQETVAAAEMPAPEVEEQAPSPVVTEQVQPSENNSNGWNGILSGLGLSGISDIGRNAGYILAMLPDMLLGMFTGKTQSLGLKDNMIPIASIIAGMFVKNPLLKMTLIGLGGANLLNKAGHEQLAQKSGNINISQNGTTYRQYSEEQQDSRIRDTQLQGNTLIATIDNIPVTIALPDKVVDAYHHGALPMSTLANAVLQRCDQMQQISQAQERFEQQTQETTRTISQR